MAEISRRQFVGSAVASAVFSIVPRHVLGGTGHVALSDKITLAHIGMGTQSFGELGNLLADPEIQIVAICDPNADSSDYIEWSKGSIWNRISENLGNPTWRDNDNGCPGAAKSGAKWWTPTTPTRGARRSLRRALPIPISGNCSRKRRTWMPSES